MRRAPARLALRELEAAAGFGGGVLFALHDARIAGEETAWLERRAQGWFIRDKRARNAVAYRAGLSGQSATGNGYGHVELPVAIGSDQRLAQDHAQHRAREIHLLVLAVHGH